MEVILASNNNGKIKEFREILSEFNITVKSLKDINYTEEIEETGSSFLENALIKAKTISLKYNKIVISDDSGLCVRALNYAPGIYSARYSKTHLDFDNNSLLLENLKNVLDRYAYYECDIVVYFPNNKYLSYKGICEGNIDTSLKGNNGFGYDPLFCPIGFKQTFGQISSDIKNKMSHRYKAIEEMLREVRIWKDILKEE